MRLDSFAVQKKLGHFFSDIVLHIFFLFWTVIVLNFYCTLRCWGIFYCKSKKKLLRKIGKTIAIFCLVTQCSKTGIFGPKSQVWILWVKNYQTLRFCVKIGTKLRILKLGDKTESLRSKNQKKSLKRSTILICLMIFLDWISEARGSRHLSDKAV